MVEHAAPLHAKRQMSRGADAPAARALQGLAGIDSWTSVVPAICRLAEIALLSLNEIETDRESGCNGVLA